MFAQRSTFQLGLILRGRKQCPRVVLLHQCTRRYHQLQNKEEAGGCGRRLNAAQFRMHSGVARRSTGVLHNRLARKAPAPRRNLVQAPSEPKSDGASQQHKVQSQQQQKQQSRQPRLGGRHHTEVTPAGAASAKVSQQQPSRKSEQNHSHYQVADAKDFAPRVGESDESGDSDSVDDYDLWEEIGDEVPAAWGDNKGSSKGKPVPPGEYFTVVRGPKKAAAPAQKYLSGPLSSAQPKKQQEAATSSMQVSGKSQDMGSNSSSDRRSSRVSGSSTASNRVADTTDSTSPSSPSHLLLPSSASSAMRATQAKSRVTHAGPSGQRAGGTSAGTPAGEPVGAAESARNQFAGAWSKPARNPEAGETKSERLRKRVLAGKDGAGFDDGTNSSKLSGAAQLGGPRSAGGATGLPPKWGRPHQLHIPKGSPVIRLAPDFEQLGHSPGYFVDLLVRERFMTSRRERHPDCPQQALALAVNQCIVRCHTVHGVLNVVRDLLPTFDLVNTSTAMHRTARTSKLGKVPSPEVLQHPCYLLLKAKAVEQTHSFEARHVANILWAVASLRDRQPHLTRHLDARVLELDLGTFEQQELSNVIWAYGKMKDCRNEELMRRASVEIMKRGFDQFVPQAISNICWAYAKHELRYEDFFQEAGNHIAEHMHAWDTQTIANIVWAYGRLEVCHDPLMAAAAHLLTSTVPATRDRPEHLMLEDFKAQEISNVTHAFAKLGSYNADVLEAVEGEMSKPERLRESTKQGIANIMWSFATLSFYPAHFMTAVCVELEGRLHMCTDQELSNCLWACARLAHHPGHKLMHTFCHSLDALMQSGQPFALQACANVLWALGVLQAANNPTAMRIVDFMSRQGGASLLNTHYHQLFQALLLARIEAQASNKQLASLLVIPDALQEEAVRQWRAMMRSSRVSMFHQDVSDVLAAMQVEHQMEFLAEDGIFSVDVAIVATSTAAEKIAVEVDGPYHYTLNTHQPLGHTLLRRRLLTALGWQVVSVPYFDWSRLYSGPHKATYLAKLLAKHGVGIPRSAILQPGFGSQMARELQKGTQRAPQSVSQEPAPIAWQRTSYDLGRPDVSWHGLSHLPQQTRGAGPDPVTHSRQAKHARDPHLRKPQRPQNSSKRFDLKTMRAFRASAQAESECTQPNRSGPSHSEYMNEVRDSSGVSAATSANIATLSCSLPAHFMPQEVKLSQGVVPSSSSAVVDKFNCRSAQIEAGMPSKLDDVPAEVRLESIAIAEAVQSVLGASAMAEHDSQADGATALAPIDTTSRYLDEASEQRLQVESMHVEGMDHVAGEGEAELSGNQASRAFIGQPASQGDMSSQAVRVAQLQQMRLAADLRPLCKLYGLITSGVKQTVIDRIAQYETLLAAEQR